MSSQWFIARQKQKHGPYPFEQLQQWARTGMLLPTEMVLGDSGKWQEAGSVAGLFDLPVAAVAVPVPSGSPTTATSAPTASYITPFAAIFADPKNRLLCIAGATGALCLILFCGGMFALVRSLAKPTDQVAQVAPTTQIKQSSKAIPGTLPTRPANDTPKESPKELPKEQPKDLPKNSEGSSWALRSSGKLTHRSGRVEDRNVQITPDGQNMVVLCDNLLQTYDLSSGRQASSFDAKSGYSSATTLAMSPDGRLLAWQSGKTISIWNQETRKLARELDGFANASHTVLSFSPDGTRLAAWARGQLKIWNIATWNQLYALNRSEFNNGGVMFSPDSKKLALGTRTSPTSYATVLWDIERQEGTRPLSQRHPIAFAPNGQTILATDFATGDLHLHDLGAGNELLTLKPEMNGSSYSIRAGDAAFSPNGNVVSALRFGKLTDDFYLWRTSDGKQLDRVSIRRTSEGEGFFHHFAFSPDGSLVALVGTVAKGKLSACLLYEIATGKMARLEGQKETVTWAAFTPDSSRLVTVGFTGELTIWDRKRGNEGTFAFNNATAIKESLLPPPEPSDLMPTLKEVNGTFNLQQVERLLGPPAERWATKLDPKSVRKL